MFAEARSQREACPSAPLRCEPAAAVQKRYRVELRVRGRDERGPVVRGVGHGERAEDERHDVRRIERHRRLALGPGARQQRALARYVLSWVWILPPLAVIWPLGLTGGETSVLFLGWVAVWAVLSRFQRDGQFWHDVWAGTRLVNSLPLSR